MPSCAHVTLPTPLPPEVLCSWCLGPRSGSLVGVEGLFADSRGALLSSPFPVFHLWPLHSHFPQRSSLWVYYPPSLTLRCLLPKILGRQTSSSLWSPWPKGQVSFGSLWWACVSGSGFKGTVHMEASPAFLPQVMLHPVIGHHVHALPRRHLNPRVVCYCSEQCRCLRAVFGSICVSPSSL